MSDEPMYLQRLRQNRGGQGKRGGAAAGAAEGLSAQEQEALRWAREAAGTELRSKKDMAGAKYAIVIRVNAASGVAFSSCEGLPSREALVERIKNAAFMSEEVVGAYEVRGGRPLTVGNAEGEITLKAGPARPGANPMPPEKMLRQATEAAAERAKSRPRDDDRGGRGRRG
ncbi:MAG TPA: hypothetical protein PK948_02445 [Gemmatimonadales bacterium]|nr:hypothetical protein [Gemmatimonadales bacterium]